ncbi:unnamed protein product [Paramecium pentaurelia]|uniref:Uncharacterized protein n=1 Tax=Paramecium pentaurelia TaxID=43138 RepID=A0A8S1TS28_9CILI|nr:unnamed protein product [Paramecium pentaurelia]
MNQKECDNFRDYKERLLDQAQQINQKHTLKYSDLNEQVLFYQGELNKQKLRDYWINGIMDLKIQNLREIDYQQESKSSIDQNINQVVTIIESDVELDIVRRMRGIHIIEKILHPNRYEIPREVSYILLYKIMTFQNQGEVFIFEIRNNREHYMKLNI